jgi:excisionase family DNA binding protein
MRDYIAADPDEKLSLVKAAPVLGVSPFTLRTWVRERKIPYYKCGRRLVFSRSDLDGFLARVRVQARV